MKWKDLIPKSYKKLYEEEHAAHEKEILSHAETLRHVLDKVKGKSEVKYSTIAAFEVSDRAFVQKIAAIADSEEMTFLLYDLKQQCVENMVNGNVEVNVQMTGILKGIDLVIKNLAGYKSMWKSIVSENANVREI